MQIVLVVAIVIRASQVRLSSDFSLSDSPLIFFKACNRQWFQNKRTNTNQYHQSLFALLTTMTQASWVWTYIQRQHLVMVLWRRAWLAGGDAGIWRIPTKMALFRSSRIAQVYSAFTLHHVEWFLNYYLPLLYNMKHHHQQQKQSSDRLLVPQILPTLCQIVFPLSASQAS